MSARGNVDGPGADGVREARLPSEAARAEERSTVRESCTTGSLRSGNGWRSQTRLHMHHTTESLDVFMGDPALYASLTNLLILGGSRAATRCCLLPVTCCWTGALCGCWRHACTHACGAVSLALEHARPLGLRCGMLITLCPSPGFIHVDMDGGVSPVTTA